MTETRQLTREALASLEQRLHALAMRAFTQHGWDAELSSEPSDGVDRQDLREVRNQKALCGKD